MVKGIRGRSILVVLVSAVLLGRTDAALAASEGEMLASAFAAYDGGDFTVKQ